MTDETATPAGRPRRGTNDDIVDAEIVDESAAEPVNDTLVPEPAHETAVHETAVHEPAAHENAVHETAVVAQPVVVEPPVHEQSAPPAHQVVYVQTPAAPRKKGNRGLGVLFAVLSGILFTALLAVATAIIGVVGGGRATFSFLGDARFYIPVLFFVVGFVLVVLVLNRAAWWAYIVGSLLLAVFVYFGTVGLGLLGQGIIAHTPAEASLMYGAALRDPFVIVSALLAREVSIWVGAGIAFRGRRVKQRNVEAHESYQRELADRRAEHGGGAVPAV